MRLDHAGSQRGRNGIVGQGLDLGLGHVGVGDPVGAVDLLGDQLDALVERRLEVVEEFEVVRLVGGLNHGLGQLNRPVAALEPVFGEGGQGAGLLGEATDHSDLAGGIRVEAVDADHRADPRLAHGLDVGNQVGAALLDQLQVLIDVGVIQRYARADLGAAAVHLERAYGGHDHDGVGRDAGETAFQVPELLEADVGAKSTLGHVVVGQACADLVGNNRALPDRDVGEGAGMHEDGLPLNRLQQAGIDRIHHPGGHGTVHLEVGRGDVVALAVLCDHDAAHAFTQVLETGRHRQDRHHFAGDGDLEAGLHFEAVHLAALADRDVAQSLRTEIERPLHLYGGGIDVEALELALGQAGIVVVVLVLHARGEGYHGQVVRVGNRVDVAGHADREGGQRYALGQPATRRRPLDVEGGTGAGLADRAHDALAELAEALHQTHGCGGLALAQGGGGDRRDVDVLGAALIPHAIKHLDEVHFPELASHRDQLLALESHLVGHLLERLHTLFGGFGDLPVLHLCGVESHNGPPCRWPGSCRMHQT